MKILAIVNTVSTNASNYVIIEFTDTRTREHCEVVSLDDTSVLFHLNGGSHPNNVWSSHEKTNWRDWRSRSERLHRAATVKEAADYIRSRIPNALVQDNALAKHAPGPWHVLPAYTGTSRYPIAHHLGDGAMGIIGEFFGQGGVGEEVTANARLAASAPELLAACQMALDSIPESVACFNAANEAEATRPTVLESYLCAAIAKATGDVK